jgi:hypothetical protein
MINTLPHEIARLAKELELLDENKYKIYCIREDFNKLRISGKTIEQCEVEVGKQYSIDPSTVHGIIYRKKK